MTTATANMILAINLSVLGAALLGTITAMWWFGRK